MWMGVTGELGIVMDLLLCGCGHSSYWGKLMLFVGCVLRFWIDSLWCALVQLLHCILKCVHLELRWLFGPFRCMLMQAVRFVCLNYRHPWWGVVFLGGRWVCRFMLCRGCLVFPLVLWPPPYLGIVYRITCGRRRVAVAGNRMICLFLIDLHFQLSGKS